MDWIELLNEIFRLCILPLLGVLTTFIVKFLRAKSAEITNQTDNDLVDKYINMLTDTICNCVIATNQTYVDALKKADTFDEAAQKEAFRLTYEHVISILSDEAKTYLTAVFGDLDSLITALIEAQVKENKSEG